MALLPPPPMMQASRRWGASLKENMAQQHMTFKAGSTLTSTSSSSLEQRFGERLCSYRTVGQGAEQLAFRTVYQMSHVHTCTHPGG